MSRDAEAKIDPKTARLYDKRTVERNIKKGLISRKDYDKYLKSLDDAAEKGVLGGPENEPDDMDDMDELDDEASDTDDTVAEEPAAATGPLDGTNNQH
jgi:hypothetical protein